MQQDQNLRVEFENSVRLIDSMRTRAYSPGDEAMLYLYSRYKQATEGDNTSQRPNPFQMRKRRMWDAWTAMQGVSCDQAMREYIAMANNL